MLSDDVFFERQRSLNPEAFGRLRKSRAIVVGGGNVGGPVVVELARAGVGEIFVVDHGIVERVNLSRGVYEEEDVGKRKVDALRRVIGRRAPYTRVDTVHGDVRTDIAEQTFSEYDIAVIASDSFSSRMHVNKWSHRFVGRLRAVISGGLVGRSWDVIVAAPGSGRGCMQCPHSAEIALSDEEGGCSTSAAGDTRGDPSVSFSGLAAATQIVDAVVDIVGEGNDRLIGKMVSFDHTGYRWDVLTIAPSDVCEGHRRLDPAEAVRVPSADYKVEELAALVERQVCAPASVSICIEREHVVGRLCTDCGAAGAPMRPLVAYRREAEPCQGCGSSRFSLTTTTTLPTDKRLSEVGLPARKVLVAVTGDRRLYIVQGKGHS